MKKKPEIKVIVKKKKVNPNSKKWVDASWKRGWAYNPKYQDLP